jgi:PleD family two-component response regulator
MAEEKRYKALIVDDQEDILRTLELMLLRSEFDVVKASHGYDALEIAAKQGLIS